MKSFVNTIGLFLFIFTGILNSCSKDKIPELKEIPVLTTTGISDLTLSSAVCGGRITYKGSHVITACGVCWSLNKIPTVADNKTVVFVREGSFSSSIGGLQAGETYYLRAYATNSVGTGYGEQISFNTMTGTVTDIDGNSYYTITIGNQEWMSENLKVTKYQNGDPIPEIEDDVIWGGLTTDGSCTNRNVENFSGIYGRLYNWYAVIDKRNVCPSGWHVPSDGEWTILTTFLGGESVAGRIMKEGGTTHWAAPNTGATNETGFTALPGGARCRCYGGMAFYDVSGTGYWWSSSQQSTSTSWYRYIYHNSINVYRSFFMLDEKMGISVRCVRD
jgi:uncharacterized protein (TIGR02145 family)